jgi:hypothetical protein
MRAVKIRGHRRRHKQIEKWRLESLFLDLSVLEKVERGYVKIQVYPWCNISVKESKIPVPRSKTKQLIFSALIDIYESWKKQLDALEKPYYLNIWLFEPRFSGSQVVCAMGTKIAHYENLFFRPAEKKLLDARSYGKLQQRVEAFHWDHCWDEDQYDNTEIGEQDAYASEEDYLCTKIWFNKLLSKPHRTTKMRVPLDSVTEYFSFKRGDVWLGGEA